MCLGRLRDRFVGSSRDDDSPVGPGGGRLGRSAGGEGSDMRRGPFRDWDPVVRLSVSR